MSSRYKADPEPGQAPAYARSPRARSKLPPLEGASNRLPPLSEVQGNVPTQLPETIISLPAPDKLAAQAPRIAMSRNISQSSTSKPLEVVIYFMDKTGVHLQVDNGQNCEAGDLFEMVMEEMDFAASAREIFSLWLVSDLLEVQMKPNQVPFQLACYWEELCEKYTSAEDGDIERDEAVIMFQRNVFFSIEKEKKVTDVELLRLLYHEAKENVVDGRYPLEPDGYDLLAGLQALINHRTYRSESHTAKYYRVLISEYYPEHLALSKKWSLFRGKGAPESRLALLHSKAYRKYGHLETIPERRQCYMAYLDFCWKLPFYGAAFFKGQKEHLAGRLRLWAVQDDPVYVAINTEGVYLIDMDDVKFLMGLKYKDLSWEYAEPKDTENRNCLPCLFLRFPSPDTNSTNILQIFSREGILMDALIEACIKLKASEQEGSGDMDDVDGFVKQESEVFGNFNQLCLATFDKEGKCTKNMARILKK